MQVGIDIVEVDRLRDIERDEKKLVKLFTNNEISYFNSFVNKTEHIAGFFCAKEAFSKALKSGFGEKLNPLDIEILHEKSGAPFLNIIKKEIKNELLNKTIEISISHTNNTATAICSII